METITLKINNKTKKGKAFIEFLKQYVLNDSKNVEVVTEQSPYNPEFVKKIKAAEKRGSYTEIDPTNVWGSLVLK